jgi:MerR family transcriptional regulator, light-induced transcriptional regulator
MADSTTLSTAAAAQLAGVAPSSVKRWADEGLLPCTRTAGGHRRFLLADVQRFLASQEAQQRPASAEAADEEWVSLLTRGDAHAVLGALFSLRGRLGAWYRVADALGRALTRVGERWKAGELTVLEEHLASERLLRALTQVSAGLWSGAGAPTCLLATAEGDEHTLGLALAELVLREAGWNTLWAGRATPSAEIVRAVASGDLDMVALSASVSSDNRARLAAQARAVGSACAEHGVPFVMGGSGAWPEARDGARRLADFAGFHALLRELGGEST